MGDSRYPEPLSAGLDVPFETVSRSESYGEQRTAKITVTGRYGDLLDKGVMPRSKIGELSAWADVAENEWFVRSVNITREEGNVGVMEVDAIKCLGGLYKPFAITWDVSMDEVQRKLIQHPAIRANADLDELFKWNETPSAYKVKTKSNGEIGYYYATGRVAAGGYAEVKEIKNEYGKKYCKAVMAGIETFNDYMPVMTKTSTYLALQGVNYDDSTGLMKDGTITEFSEDGKVGSFDTPDLVVSGYTTGVWFKSKDALTANADGTWTRTEQWTYTWDTDHKWIYDERNQSN